MDLAIALGASAFWLELTLTAVNTFIKIIFPRVPIVSGVLFCIQVNQSLICWTAELILFWIIRKMLCSKTILLIFFGLLLVEDVVFQITL